MYTYPWHHHQNPVAAEQHTTGEPQADVTTGFDSTFGGRLTFTNPFGYNGTDVTCRAELRFGQEVNATALLLVQGNSFVNTLHPCSTTTLGFKTSM